MKEQSHSLQNRFTSKSLLSSRDKYTEAWTHYLAKQRERESSDSCADELVTARVFIGDEVDDAKSKITKEVVKLCDMHNFEQRKGRTETETERKRKRKFATILYMIKYSEKSSQSIHSKARLLPSKLQTSTIRGNFVPHRRRNL